MAVNIVKAMSSHSVSEWGGGGGGIYNGLHCNNR